MMKCEIRVLLMRFILARMYEGTGRAIAVPPASAAASALTKMFVLRQRF